MPALPPEQVRSLVDANGMLPAKPGGLAGADRMEVMAEVRAQLRRFREIMGRDPTHFDSHHHSHREVPAVFDAILAVAWETGLPVRSASAAMAAQLKREGVPTPDHLVEDFYADGATLNDLIGIVEDLPVGTSELMCHPAVVDAELRSTSGYAEPRTRELDVLTRGGGHRLPEHHETGHLRARRAAACRGLAGEPSRPHGHLRRRNLAPEQRQPRHVARGLRARGRAARRERGCLDSR